MNRDIQTNNSFQSTLIDRFYLKCIKKIGFNSPTPIQYYSLKEGLNKQVSLICQSKSGTGKTLSYLTLILSQIFTKPQITNQLYSLVLVPTRQLAIQVYQNLRQILESKQGVKPQDQKEKLVKIKMKEMKVMLTIGGIPFEDDKKKYIQHGAHIIVGTVGRVYQLSNKNIIKFDSITTIALDQGDKLWQNKNHNFQQLMKLLKHKRLLLFSATYTNQIIKEVKHFSDRHFTFIQTLAIDDKLSLRILKDEEIKIEEAQEQKCIMNLDNIHKFQVEIDIQKSTIFNAKLKALTSILNQCKYRKCLIFVEKKALLGQISQRLNSFEHVLIHGSLTQAARIKLMNKMNDSKIILSSDLLARGIDFVLDLVILFDAKQNDTFWHRIGRTGRFGRSGVAISLDKIGWQAYSTEKINQILSSLQLQEKKEYYGKYLSELSQWAEVNEENQKQITRNYRYFNQNQIRDLQQEIANQQEITLKTNKKIHFNPNYSENKETEFQQIPSTFQTEKNFEEYIKRLLKCQKCLSTIEETQKLTGYKFEIMKYLN